MGTLGHRLAVILAVLYFAALAGILLWPTPVDQPVRGDLAELFSWLLARGVPRWLVDYARLEFCANVLLFIPFGMVLALRLPRPRWWLALPIAAVVSGAVELLQGALLPDRFPAFSDVVANTSGALLGALIVVAFRRHGRRVRRPA